MGAARGTTPTFDLSVRGVDLNEARNVYATFKYFNGVITKSGDDLEIAVTEEDETSVSTVSVYFRQEETLRFAEQVDIQLNWTYDGGERASTNIVRYCFSGQLLNEVVE